MTTVRELVAEMPWIEDTLSKLGLAKDHVVLEIDFDAMDPNRMAIHFLPQGSILVIVGPHGECIESNDCPSDDDWGVARQVLNWLIAKSRHEGVGSEKPTSENAQAVSLIGPVYGHIQARKKESLMRACDKAAGRPVPDSWLRLLVVIENGSPRLYRLKASWNGEPTEEERESRH